MCAFDKNLNALTELECKLVMKLMSLLLPLVVLLAGCNTTPPLLSLEQLDAYRKESRSHTMAFVSLYKEDDSFYYLRIGVASIIGDCFRLSKKDVVINVEGELPVFLKTSDIQRKN